MSQRGEKYARYMERRVEKLEEWADNQVRNQDKVNGKLVEYGLRLQEIEADTDQIRTIHDNEVDARRREDAYTSRKLIYHHQEFGRAIARQNIVILLALLTAAAALIVAAMSRGGNERAKETAQPAATMTARVEADLLAIEPAEIDTWAFVALYRAAEDPLEAERIGEALEAQGYFSAAVPLSWEYQDYMRTYCHLYGCPYPLALAVADWETRGQFNMDAVGPAGEVGIMQLLPGPDGSYHAELEAATGLDPATPEGNIAGGCYMLGKYMDLYGDPARAAMAYNMGQAGATKAQEAGTTSTDYTDAVLEAMERWECAVNAWAGE